MTTRSKRRTASEAGESEVSLSTIIKVIRAVAAVIIGLGAIVAPLWGYFGLQRDTLGQLPEPNAVRSQIVFDAIPVRLGGVTKMCRQAMFVKAFAATYR